MHVLCVTVVCAFDVIYGVSVVFIIVIVHGMMMMMMMQKKIREGHSQWTLVQVGLMITQDLHRKCIKIVHFLCQSRVLVRPVCTTGHCEWD